MSEDRRWHWVPRTRSLSALYLLVGVLVTFGPVWQMTKAGEITILPAIAVIAGLAVIVMAIVGLASPRLRGR